MFLRKRKEGKNKLNEHLYAVTIGTYQTNHHALIKKVTIQESIKRKSCLSNTIRVQNTATQTHT